MTKCKLSPCALGLALGTLWAISVLLVGLLAFLGVEGGLVAMLHRMHTSHGESIVGLLIAAFFGLVDGFIHGFFLAFLYNFFSDCSCKKSGKCA